MLEALMERLGWVPKADLDEYMHWHDEVVRLGDIEIEKLNATVRELSALIGVYPLTDGENSVVADVPKKKRGRPRKYARKA